MLFNAYDPRGYNVVLDERTYERHIVNRHGDDVTPDEIRQAVESPDLIVADETNSLTEIYYARGIVQLADESEYLKVVARFESDHMKVVTAYMVDVPKRTERVIWPPQR